MDSEFYDACEEFKKSVLAGLKDGRIIPMIIIERENHEDSMAILDTTTDDEERVAFYAAVREMIKTIKPLRVISINWGDVEIQKHPTEQSPIVKVETSLCVLIDAANHNGEKYNFCQLFHFDEINKQIVFDKILDFSKGIAESRLLDGLFDTVN